MSIKHLSLVLFFFSQNLSAQLDSLQLIENKRENQTLCEQGELLAKENMAKGVFHVISYGGKPPIGDAEFIEFHKRYCLRKYGVKIGYGGGTSTSFYDCYTAVMRDSVLSKFGDNFFLNVFEEAKMEYAILLVKEIESDKVYFKVDSMPSFPGGYSALGIYFKENIKSDSEKDGRVIISMVVEKDGTFSSIELMRGIDSIIDQEIIELLGEMPKWNPGIKGGKKVRTQIYLPIRYVPTSKRKED